MSPSLQGSLLLADDEPAITRALYRALRTPPAGQPGADLTCNCGTEAFGERMAQHFDIIASDLRMPNMGGMEPLVLAAGLQPGCVLIILTGTADFTTAQEAVNRFGLYRHLTKPWDADGCVVMPSARQGAKDTRPH